MLTKVEVNRLPYSDHIVCLGPKGELLEQGAFDDLNSAGGHVSSFSLPQADWTYDPVGKPDDKKGVDREHCLDLPHSKEIAHVESPSSSSDTTCEDDIVIDASRQTGDVRIYTYYVKSVGGWTSLIFVVAIVGFIFCVSFPSKQSFP